MSTSGVIGVIGAKYDLWLRNGEFDVLIISRIVFDNFVLTPKQMYSSRYRRSRAPDWLFDGSKLSKNHGW